MPLSIGVSVGSEIDINGHILQVRSIPQPNLMVVTLDNGPDILVTDKDKKEILPQVFLQTGLGKSGGANRLAFMAPREIRISRIENTRRSHRGTDG